MAAGAPGSLVGAAADQLEQRRFVVAFSPQLWHVVPCFCAGEVRADLRVDVFLDSL